MTKVPSDVCVDSTDGCEAAVVVCRENRGELSPLIDLWESYISERVSGWSEIRDSRELEKGLEVPRNEVEEQEKGLDARELENGLEEPREYGDENEEPDENEESSEKRDDERRVYSLPVDSFVSK